MHAHAILVRLQYSGLRCPCVMASAFVEKFVGGLIEPLLGRI